MFAQFRYLDGAAAGRTRVAAADFATIGRHPSSDVPFDPEHDLQVSVRHAAVFKQGGGFLVRDLGSTNGTFLNGARVRGDRPLEPHDVLQLGPTGPRLEFTTVEALPRAAAEPPPPPPPPPRRRTRPTARLSAPPRREPSRRKWLVAGAVALAVVAAGQWQWQARRDRAAVELQRASLLGRLDDLVTRLDGTRSPVPGIEAALAAGRREAAALRAAIAIARGPASLDSLAGTLVARGTRHEAVLRAARLDPEELAGPTRAAVAVVVAEQQGGRVVSGTGFAIRSSGDTVWLVTARRLVQDSAALPARRLAVILNGSRRAVRATLARLHDSADLALVTARMVGGAPVVKGIADAAAVGDAVAVVGFPGGLDSTASWRTTGAAARVAVGTVTAAGRPALEVDGYGSAPAAGAPVVGPGGLVIGVVSGGGPPGGRGGLAAVPGRVVQELTRGAPGR